MIDKSLAQAGAPVMAYLSLGSNLGDRRKHLREALAMLSGGKTPALKAVRCSRLYEVPALLPAGAPKHWDVPFLNMVIDAQALCAPLELLARIHEIESALKREREGVWSPRTIDVDILLYGDVVMDMDALTIPHMQMYKRVFVMKPLAELAPHLRWPEGTVFAGALVRDCAEALDDGGMKHVADL